MVHTINFLSLEHSLHTFEHNPHETLGLHRISKEQQVIRIYRPDAKEVFFELKGTIVKAEKTDKSGFFEYTVDSDITYKDYRIFHTSSLLAHDPYAFWPTFSELDRYLFGCGVHYSLHHQMGARLCTHMGINGVMFTVWAPSAKRVSVIGDFNHWDGRVNPMRSLGASGVWEIFIPGLFEGCKYKFEVITQENTLLIKADPFALSSEIRPKTASVVASIDTFEWHDHEWMQKRKLKTVHEPFLVYEVHLGSWKKNNGYFKNYREIAHELCDYVKTLGYTHIELLPISEHPLDESWGYQVTGFFSATSRFGTPADFQYFVNYMHQHNIGVILDWVPGHFPTDDFALSRFDGTALYEHEDPRQGFHPHWKTHIFNFGRREVSNFLIASALFWLDVYHIDGLRVDAVASMLYLDYGREHDEWIPNIWGGKENLEAIEFLKHANSVIHEQFPGVVTIAEESTAFPRITHPLWQGGLGFDFKWNMGWMNDTLRYFSKDSLYRTYHHNDLTFGLLYAFQEKFALVLSHDEVVHGKKSLLSKMPGDMWQKFANVRLLYSYAMCQPGKKLFFMGAEIAQWNEWNATSELNWNLLDYPLHKGMQTMVHDINHLYQKEAALWQKDFDYSGFEWVDFSDSKNSAISYFRKSFVDGEEKNLLCIHNFTPSFFPEYSLHLGNMGQNIKKVEEIFNSDSENFGGSGKAYLGHTLYFKDQHTAESLQIKLAPLATMIFRVYY